MQVFSLLEMTGSRVLSPSHPIYWMGRGQMNQILRDITHGLSESEVEALAQVMTKTLHEVNHRMAPSQCAPPPPPPVGVTGHCNLTI